MNDKLTFTAQDMGNFAMWYRENARPFECNMMWHLEKWLSLPINIPDGEIEKRFFFPIKTEKQFLNED